MIIGLFTDTYLPDINGVATATETLRSILVSHGHRVIIVTTGLPKQKEFSFENDVMRIPGMTLSFLYGYRMAFFYNSKAYRILKKIPFDLIHVQQEFGVSTFGRLCARKLNVPLVYTYHTSYEDYSNYISHGAILNDKLTKKAIRSLTKRLISIDGEIITPSTKTKKKLKNIGVTQYIHVIPNAIDLTPFYQNKDKEKEEQFRKEHHIEGKRILLSLGRLAFEKNVAELIEGFNAYKISYNDKNIVLLIVGSGPEERKLMAQRDKSPFRDDILFLPAVSHEETLFYYQIADCFLCASTTETQGLTYSEAIASDTLVLARYDFNLDPLIEDGVTGFFYDSQELIPEKIHEVLTLSEEDRARIKEAAHQRNRELFSPDSYYQRIMEVYRKAIRHAF